MRSLTPSKPLLAICTIAVMVLAPPMAMAQGVNSNKNNNNNKDKTPLLPGAVYGDPHFAGLDGSKFDYHTEGESLLLKDGAGFSLFGTMENLNGEENKEGTWMTGIRMETPDKHSAFLSVDLDRVVSCFVDGVELAPGSKVSVSDASKNVIMSVHRTAGSEGLPGVMHGHMDRTYIKTPFLELVVELEDDVYFNMGVDLVKPMVEPVTGVMGDTYNPKPDARMDTRGRIKWRSRALLTEEPEEKEIEALQIAFNMARQQQ